MATVLLLLLVAVIVWFFASARTRRDDAVERRVERMVVGRQNLATFSDLYFEAARAYAISKGARAPEHDAASATMLVGGTTYFVVFMRDSGGGTTISVEDAAAVEREIMSFSSR